MSSQPFPGSGPQDGDGSRPAGPWGPSAPSPVPPMSHGYGAPDRYAPYGRDPMTGEPFSDRSKVVAGLLQIFFGSLGIGRFYMGSTAIAVTQLVLTLIGYVTMIILIGFLIVPAVALWALIDGFVILAGRPRDGRGLLLRS